MNCRFLKGPIETQEVEPLAFPWWGGGGLLPLPPLCTDPWEGTCWRWVLTHAASHVWKKRYSCLGGGQLRPLIMLGARALGFCFIELPMGAGNG